MPLLLSLSSVAFILGGCNPQPDSSSKPAEQALDAEVEAAERPFFDAARPFAEAIAARDYLKAFEYLSSHARARMSPSQFVPPDDDAAHKSNEAAAVLNTGPEQFAGMMAATEKQFGRPSKLLDLNVFSMDPVALSGKGTAATDKLESMFAIGMMPESIPAEIRKASLRSRLAVELGPEQLAETAKVHQTTPEKLKADPDFDPYITLKMVLVQEAGSLKVGYFEFLPPGIWD